MEPTTTEDIVLNTKNWAEERLEKAESIGAKDAIYKEFEEWIELDEDDKELDILSLEPLEEYFDDEDIELLVLEPINEIVEELDED